MQHIISFAIDIDDSDLKNKIEESVKSEVTKKICDKISENIVSSWGSLTILSKDIIEKVMERHQDKILKQAVNNITETIKRSKKYKETLKSISELAKEEDE
jgi:hypothetical protein